MSVKTFVADMLLPVNPFEEIAFSVAADNKSLDIVSLGEVTAIGPRKLAGCTIKSLLTAKQYPFTVSGATVAPVTFINRMYGLLDDQRPIRFIVTGTGMEINMLCSVEKFKHSERFGEPGEFYYELELKEYRSYAVKRVQIAGTASAYSSAASATTVRAGEPAAVSNYVVRSGDSLSGIAKVQLGDSSRWREIYELNKATITNPNVIKVGQSLVMPSR